MTDESDLLTASEAAELVGRPFNTIGSWARSGALPKAGRKQARSGLWTNAYRRADVLRLHAESQTRDFHEPTAEEVEAMVAEQMRPENLPRWWPVIGPDIDPDGDDDAPEVARSLAEARAAERKAA